LGSAEGLKATLSTAMTSKTTATAYSESSADRFASNQPDSEYNKIKKHTSSEAKPIKIRQLLDVHRERESQKLGSAIDLFESGKKPVGAMSANKAELKGF
jgi:hypothetical protein